MIYAATSSNLKYGILRFFNAAGADIENGLIEKHVPETHVIPLAIQTALSGGTFKIFGDSYDTPDGTAIRDFIHILDLARAHVAALNRLLLGEDSFVCNLGSGNPTSIKTIVEVIRESYPEFRVAIETVRLGDPSRLVANIERARQLLDWSPEHSGIKEIIQSSIQAEISEQI
jgi:UDP-glucose 4-epimerase